MHNTKKKKSRVRDCDRRECNEWIDCDYKTLFLGQIGLQLISGVVWVKFLGVRI